MATKLYDEFETVIKLIEFVFYLVGINFFGVRFEENIWKRCLRRIPTILIISSPIPAIAAFLYNINDYIKVVESIFAISAFFQISLKYCILHTVLHDIIELVEKCRTFRRNQARDIERTKDKVNGNRLIARPVLMIKIFVIFLIITLTIILVTPLMRSGRTIPLPLYWVFISPMETPFYEINYGLTSAVLCCFATFTLGVETVLISFVSEVCLQANVIKYKLSTLGEDGEDDQRSKIREICQLHWDLVSSINDLNHIYTNLSLVQFSTNFLMLSSSLFMFAKNDYSFLASAICVTVQLGVYCLYGEIIKDKFERFMFSLYNNQWYNLNSSEKKVLIIMMSNTQAIPTLKAVGYMELSMETYFQILKTAYSYLAIMQNME